MPKRCLVRPPSACPAASAVLIVAPLPLSSRVPWLLRADSGRRAGPVLNGRVKTGHLWTPQNRPFPAARDWSRDLLHGVLCWQGVCRRASRHARSLWAVRQPPVPTDPDRKPARATPRSRSRPAIPATHPATPGTVPATPGASARRRSTAVAATPVRWPTVPDPGFAGPPPLPVTCLPLGVGQLHTTMLHRYVTDRRKRSAERSRRKRGDTHHSVVIGIGVCVRVGPRQRARGNAPSVGRALCGPVSRVGSEPDVGVGHARPGYARETQRPAWAGRCGQRRRVGKGVASSDHSSAAEGSSGARGDRGDDHWRLLRQTSLEAALSRARTTSGWALTLGRARILRSAVQRRGNWRNAADAFGRQPNAGYRRTGGGNVPTGFGLRPGATAPDAPPTLHRLRASRRLYRGGPHPGAPAARPALEHVRVMQEPVE